MEAGWMMWRRRPETFRIVMESSQSGLSLPHIVATSRVDVQRGVAHAAMWRKTRPPCTMRGYDYCGLQGGTSGCSTWLRSERTMTKGRVLSLIHATSNPVVGTVHRCTTCIRAYCA